MSRWVKIIAATLVVTATLIATTDAQIIPRRDLPAVPDRFDNLQTQLINRLRATTEAKQAYIRRLVVLVRTKKLDPKLVVAIERKALQQRPAFPFPYFEQAIKFEAAKRNVKVLTVGEYEAAQIARNP